MRTLVVLATVAMVLGGAGCRKKDAANTPENPDDPTLLGEDGADTSAVETDGQLLTTSLVSASASGGALSLASLDDASISAKGLGDATKAIYFPRGCLTVAVDTTKREATYDFDDCTGPNGLLKVHGSVKVNYVVDGDTLVLDIVGTDLKINKATADWSAHAEITVAGAKRTMHWTAQLAGTTARGRDFTRTNDKTVEWSLGDRCFSVSGTAEGTVKDRDVKTVIDGFRRCQGACPEAGGKITITNVGTGTSVEIDFDGTSTAQIIAPKGAVSLPLLCQ